MIAVVGQRRHAVAWARRWLGKEPHKLVSFPSAVCGHRFTSYVRVGPVSNEVHDAMESIRYQGVPANTTLPIEALEDAR